MAFQMLHDWHNNLQIQETKENIKIFLMQTKQGKKLIYQEQNMTGSIDNSDKTILCLCKNRHWIVPCLTAETQNISHEIEIENILPLQDSGKVGTKFCTKANNSRFPCHTRQAKTHSLRATVWTYFSSWKQYLYNFHDIFNACWRNTVFMHFLQNYSSMW